MPALKAERAQRGCSDASAPNHVPLPTNGGPNHWCQCVGMRGPQWRSALRAGRRAVPAAPAAGLRDRLVDRAVQSMIAPAIISPRGADASGPAPFGADTP